MNIAVNTRLLLKNRLEGIGWFACETFKRITQSHPEHKFLFLFDRPWADDFIFGENIQPILLRPQARHPVLFKIWFEWSVSKALIKHRADLFISPDGYLSLNTEVPSVAVIHDINFEHRPDDLPPHILRYYKKYFPKFARKAKRIATVSEYSKNDIADCYHIDPHRIDVVYNGANLLYKPLDESKQRFTRQAITDGKPYLFYLGSLHRRKNIPAMLKAYDLFKKETGADLKFVLAGAPLWKDTELKCEVNKLASREDIVFLGYQTPEQLAGILPSALALILVSHFEGFGIPVLEAMYCDVPVIASRTTAIPEITGDAAMLVNPESVEEIKNAICSLWKHPHIRNELIEKGRKQRKHFSWELTAEKMWQCILKATAC